jgi:hypothetical protein
MRLSSVADALSCSGHLKVRIVGFDLVSSHSLILRHLGFLEVVDELSGPFAPRFPYGAKDARLGDAAEIAFDRWGPAGRDCRDPEPRRSGQHERARGAWVVGFVNRIERQRDAVSEQGLPADAIERDQRVPEVGGFPGESRDPR